jgi:hypothetical protein
MNHPTLDAEDVHQGHVVGDATEGSSGNFPENIDGYEDGSGESSPRCKNCRTIDDELFYDAVETW